MDGKPINLGLWDTAGQDDYDRLRPLSYPETVRIFRILSCPDDSDFFQDVFLVCFSVTSHSSLHIAVSKYIPEVSHHCPDTPIILVGTNIELREDPVELQRLKENRKTFVTEESVIHRCYSFTYYNFSQVKEIIKHHKSKGVKLVKYLECSAQTQENVKNVFDEAIRCAMKEEENVGYCLKEEEEVKSWWRVFRFK